LLPALANRHRLLCASSNSFPFIPLIARRIESAGLAACIHPADNAAMINKVNARFICLAFLGVFHFSAKIVYFIIYHDDSKPAKCKKIPVLV
jgi:hypothetical protein